MKHLERLLVLAICWVWGAGAAHPCRCDPISAYWHHDHPCCFEMNPGLAARLCSGVVEIWRATADDDGQYLFAVAL